MAALPPFLAYISHLHSQALAYDVPSPLLDVLLPLLSALSTPSSSYSRPLRLTALIEAITLAPIFKTSGMFNRMREQQDAQELWQLLMSAVEEEAEAIHKIGIKEGSEGLRALIATVSPTDDDRPEKDSPFKGRLAYRRGCRICGYSEGIRLTAFDNLQLSVPRTVSPRLCLIRLRSSADHLTFTVSSPHRSLPSSSRTRPSTSSLMPSVESAGSRRPSARSNATCLFRHRPKTRRPARSRRQRRSVCARHARSSSARRSSLTACGRSSRRDAGKTTLRGSAGSSSTAALARGESPQSFGVKPAARLLTVLRVPILGKTCFHCRLLCSRFT